jgi:cytidylate kinase
MIIMINGAFGVGKSTTAALLYAALPNSMIYDPEEVGYMLRKVTAGIRPVAENTGDFQDIALWRTLAVTVAERLYRHYGRDLIVPMTLANPDYFREFRTGFAQFEKDLYHFCLVAAPETIYRRLEERGDSRDCWAAQQAVRCVMALQAAEFAMHIDTEQYRAEEVAALILRTIASS